MKPTIKMTLGAVLGTAMCLHPAILPAQGTAFTYQGRLDTGGSPANGSYDLRVAVFDAASGGNQRGLLTNTAVAVSNGLFTVTLDFGFGVFNGPDRWLEIGVRTNGGGEFTALSPRQAVLPAPYAFWAANASQAVTVSGTVPASGLNGLYSNPVTFNNPANSFTGNGAGLSNVNAATLGGRTAAQFWQTGGNTGANPTNGAFLGTADNLPLELRANNQRALRLEPNPNSPNVVGGSPANLVTNGNYGAVIAGGGSAAYPNRVGAPFAAVLGGAGNTASGNFATAAGQFATAEGYASAALGYSTTAGGFGSLAAGTEARAEHDGAFVWADNTFAPFSSTAINQFSIRAAGGIRIWSDPGIALNAADTPLITRGFDPFGPAAPAAKQGHGRWGLFMEPSALTLGIPGDDIPGRIFQVAKYDTNGLATGLLRVNQDGGVELHGPIYSPAGRSLELLSSGASGLRLEPTLGGANVVGGWSGNLVSNGVIGATIAGGGGYDVFGFGPYTNMVTGDFGTVGGGGVNTAAGQSATVAGGWGNVARFQDTVGGGWDNRAVGGSSTVGGGAHNTASGGYSTVAGGVGNDVTGDYAAVGGGWYNLASGLKAVVGGGDGNQATGQFATVPGGYANHAGGKYSLAAGEGALAMHDRTFVWADGSALGFGSTSSNQFLIRAKGGVGVNTSDPGGATLAVNGLTTSSTARINGNNNWDVNNTEGDFRVGNDVQRFKIGIASSGGGAGDVWMRAQGGTQRLFLKTPGGTTIYSNEGQSSGVTLAAGGGAWTTVSDRNAKENFAPVDPQAVLEKVAALPLTTWNYKSQDASIRHLGPVAQDFKAAFGLGESDTGITTVDADGVALAAIQGLNEKVERGKQKAETRMEKLEAENAALRQELQELKQLVRALVCQSEGDAQ